MFHAFGNNPVCYKDPDGNSFIEKLKAIPYFIAGTMVGLGTLVEDGATGGVGLADDPASLALVGGLYALGMAHWTKTDDTHSNATIDSGVRLQSAQAAAPSSPQNDNDRKNKTELSQSAKDAKKIDRNSEANKFAKNKGFDDAHDLKKYYVGKDNISKFDIYVNSTTKEEFLINKARTISVPIN